MKKKIIVFTIFILPVIGSYSQSAIFDNYYAAEKLVAGVRRALNFEADTKYNYKFSYEGSEYNLGHYSTPGQTTTYQLKGELAFFNDLLVSNNLVLTLSGRSYHQKSISNIDSIFLIDFGKTAVTRKLNSDYRKINLYSPYQIIELIDKNKNSLHLLSETAKNDIIGFNDRNGDKYYLTINNNTKLISSIKKIMYDDIYGDITEEILFNGYIRKSGFSFPTKIRVKKGENLVREFVCADFKIGIVIDPNLATELQYKILAEEGKNKFNFTEISNNLWLIEILNLNNKVLLFIDKGKISFFEAPKNVTFGRSLIKEVRQKFPNTIIKYCFLSHHHPDHAGGMLAFLEIGATIVTTQSNKEYFSKLYQNKHTLGSFAKLSSISPPQFEIVPNNSFKKYVKNQLHIYESGNLTSHTKEYLFFYFKKDKILFVGDLLRFNNDSVLAQGKRAYSVFQVIKINKLAVNKIYTSWPLHNQKKFGTWEDLIAVLKSKYPKISN